MVHLIWSGKGYIVPVVIFLASLIMELCTEAIYKDEDYYQTHGWPVCWAFIISAFIVGFIAPKLFRERKLRDVKTGEIVVLRENHTFFFIHIKHWGLILSVLGLLFYYLVEENKI